MKRLDYRILAGAVLILGGIFMLLDRTNLLKGATNFFWAAILAAGAALFLFWFFRDPTNWWTAIPGFTLAGMSVSTLLHNQDGWGGLAFLGGIGLGFWAIYFSDRTRWWAILPGGVMLSLAATSVMTEAFGAKASGGVFLVGLGITFVLVGWLAKMKWAFIPAAVLLLLGLVFSLPFAGITQYVWIGILLAAGAVLLVSALRK
jgi:hypothetical protein